MTDPAPSHATARQPQGLAKVAPPASLPRLDDEPPDKEERHGQQRTRRLAALGRKGGPGRRRAAGGRGAGGVDDRQRRRHRHPQLGQPLPGQRRPVGQRPAGKVDESKSQRPDEHLLTGDTASKVRAAALARYPGATVLRVETDSDGVYEAHQQTSAGQRVTVEVDKSFKVTGEEAYPQRP